MSPHEEVQRVFREHHGWVLAGLMRSVRDIDLAEDALQQVLESALVQWPRAGVPDSPRAWLLAAARHRAIDELRRRTLHQERGPELLWLETLSRQNSDAALELPIADDVLRLLFTCCHPALNQEAQVALMLRTIAGLETDEIARAFLVPQVTMAQRLVRAKKKIRAAGVPFEVPAADEIDERISGVLAAVYLIFNEGYGATRGADLVRRDLCHVAIRLGRSLVELLPDHGEVRGLLALMLLVDARAAARVDPDGNLVLLEDQDRSLWDRAQIERGLSMTRDALRLPCIGAYALQAAISAVHSEAETASNTDWPQIAALYQKLIERAPTPVVRLNHAVAVAMACGFEVGLSRMEELSQELQSYHLFHSARADLLRRLGRSNEARQAYARAIALCQNDAERRFLEGRVVGLG